MKRIIDYKRLSKKSIDSKLMFDSFKRYLETKDIKFLLENHIPIFHRYYNRVLKNIPWDDTPYEDYCQEYVLKLIKFIEKYKDRLHYYGTYYNFVDKMTYNFCVTRHSSLQGKAHTQEDYTNLDKYKHSVFKYGEGQDLPRLLKVLEGTIRSSIMENRPLLFQNKVLNNTEYTQRVEFLVQSLLGEGENSVPLTQKKKKKDFLTSLIIINYRWILLKNIRFLGTIYI